jgi:hypothetical protein
MPTDSRRVRARAPGDRQRPAGSSPFAALSRPREHEASFLEEKLITARFYGEQLLPTANGLVAAVKGGSSLLDDAIF